MRNLSRFTPDACREMALPLVRDLLGSGRSVRLAACGWSMRPFLRDGDVVEIAPATISGLRRGDVAAVAASPDEDAGPGSEDDLIVHRFVRREGARLVLQGDACPAPDAPVPESALLGRVVVRER
ncbi:MAG TPA: S24/S26 family peptidase, partial [Sumerlaeia bacterium]|nr:S24/S26 family peptidase [Sumerlaeia bacterium]